MNVAVRTDRYLASHGKKAPRGTGAWAFQVRMPGYFRTDLFWTAGGTSYSEAKKSAVQHARNVGGLAVWVMP